MYITFLRLFSEKIKRNDYDGYKVIMGMNIVFLQMFEPIREKYHGKTSTD